MKEVNIYLCDSEPRDDEIEEAIQLAKEKKCIIKLLWYHPKKRFVFIRSYDSVDGVRSTIDSKR